MLAKLNVYACVGMPVHTHEHLTASLLSENDDPLRQIYVVT